MLAVKLLSTDDEVAWRDRLPASLSVFGSLEFARIVEKHSHLNARLAVILDDVQIAYPLFRRSTNDLPFVNNASRGFWDTHTPEYTGPMIRGALPPNSSGRFRDALDQMFVEEKIVAEFIHPHPWNFGAEVRHVSALEFDREIVYVDVKLSDDQLWNVSLNYACRKNLKRAEQKGVHIFAATEPDHIVEFYRIYQQTMDRAGALKKYYFPLQYFLDLFQQLPDHTRFVLAEYQKEIAAATLYLHDDIDVYSYLGGADYSFQEVRPTNAVVYDTIRWARQAGKKRLILGGGYRPDDGIFRFKAGFSPLRANFRVYKQIHLKDEYDGLCRDWSTYYKMKNKTLYFPAYRAAPPVHPAEAVS